MPSSSIKVGIAEILKNEGFITDFSVSEEKGKKTLTIVLKYSNSGERVITNLKRVSKPGLRVYAQADKIPSVLKGLGIAIVSTPNGLLTDKEARKANVGGEILAYVW
jgi:small subunit ribosomal protein S8